MGPTAAEPLAVSTSLIASFYFTTPYFLSLFVYKYSNIILFGIFLIVVKHFCDKSNMGIIIFFTKINLYFIFTVRLKIFIRYKIKSGVLLEIY